MGSVYEDLADLYLRLNGYFTVKNFFQHPLLWPATAETDIDILAVRLPHEREVTGREPQSLPNDELVVDPKSRAVTVVVAEAKGDASWFNDRWFNDREVLCYTLRRVGFTQSEKRIERVAQDLRTIGRAAYSGGAGARYLFRLVLFSDYAERPRLSKAQVIGWEAVLDFLRARYELMTRQAGRSPIKRGVGPLKDSLFGFLYEEAFLKDRLARDFLRSIPGPRPYYRYTPPRNVKA